MTLRRFIGVGITGLLAAALAAGCGSSKTKVDVVTVTAPAHGVTTFTSSTSPTTPSTATKTSSSTSAAPSASTSTSTSTSTTGGVAAPPDGPASAQGAGGADLSAAEATVKAKGYTPSVTYTYKPANTLGVILGTRAAGDQRAFFFVRGKFLGTDTSDPSAGIVVVGQDDTSVTLSYALYQTGDKLCCPSSHASVTYALNDGKLEPQGSIPSSSSSATLSRR